jgi:hypothetical protein
LAVGDGIAGVAGLCEDGKAVSEWATAAFAPAKIESMSAIMLLNVLVTNSQDSVPLVLIFPKDFLHSR